MITSLFIENYALIQHTEISFHPGFVTITGETGAGKSIILGALGLLLGQRADLTVLGDKEKKCIIEAHFDISNSGLEPLFEELDLDYDPLLVIRRELLPSGKSRAFVNETPATLTALDALGQELIDIHSQHQTLTLTESAFQIKILDRIGYI
ncbi:MAG: AAA family ATPase, partial [Bacteroidales bacterium]|nr:AAA family ATPase [Candidatus Colimorpha onthohippi]